MLIGTYSHTVDAKGRMFMPAKLREDLGEKFIVTQGVDKCLFVYSLSEWEKFSEKIRELPITNKGARSFARMFFANACECEPDKQGRILLPQRLREFIGLDKDAVITGVNARAEIWAKEVWDGYSDQSEDEEDENLAMLAELGII